MPFRFDPRRTRQAAAAIAKAFPIQSPKTPPGLHNLFRTLAALAVEEVPIFGANLSTGEWELLWQKYRLTSDAKVLITLAVVLAHRGDRRSTDILGLGFHQLPSRPELRFLEEARARYDLGGTLNDDVSWVGACLNRPASESLVAFLGHSLQEERLTFAELLGEIEGETPLLNRLMESVFSSGGQALRSIPAERASEWATRFLEEGEDDRLARYLNDYPESGWKPDFLERLYRVKGPPDPGEQAFYRSLEKGRVWGIRKKCFAPRLPLSGLSPARLELWRRWLHRCRDCRWDGTDLHFFIEKLHLVEQHPATRVFLSERLLETIPFDHGWASRLETLLGEVLPWGYHV